MVDLLPTLAVLLLSIWVASRYIWRFGSDERSLLWTSFVAHQLAGMINIWVTNYYYRYGDMSSYHAFGVVAADQLHVDFWGLAPGLIRLLFHGIDPLPIPIETLTTSSGSMQAISAFGMFFLFYSLYAVCALIAAGAFFSKVALYQVVREELPHLPKRPLLFVCTLLPSTLFWSCSLLKEPIAMIGVLSALYGWHQLIKRRRVFRGALILILGSCAILVVKGYIFPALCLAAGVWHFARKVHERRGDISFKAGHVLIAVSVATVMVVVTGALLPQFAPEALSDQLAGLQNVGTVTDGGSNYTLGRSSGSSSNQALLAPLGLITALFRPFLLEVRTPIVLLSALEMMCFLVAAITVLLRRGVLGSLSELVRHPFLSFCAVFVTIFGTCVGLGTTNLGTLSRYRIPLAPFFATILLALMAKAPVVSSILRPGARPRLLNEPPPRVRNPRPT